MTAKQLAKAHAAGVTLPDRLGDRLRGHPGRRVARPRAGDVRRVHGHVADGGHRRGHRQRRLRHAHGGRSAPSSAAASPTSWWSTATRWPTSRSCSDKDAHRRGHQGGQPDRPDHADPRAPAAHVRPGPLPRRVPADAVARASPRSSWSGCRVSEPGATRDRRPRARRARDQPRAPPGAAGPELGASPGRHAVLPRRRLLAARRQVRRQPVHGRRRPAGGDGRRRHRPAGALPQPDHLLQRPARRRPPSPSRGRTTTPSPSWSGKHPGRLLATAQLPVQDVDRLDRRGPRARCASLGHGRGLHRHRPGRAHPRRPGARPAVRGAGRPRRPAVRAPDPAGRERARRTTRGCAASTSTCCSASPTTRPSP